MTANPPLTTEQQQFLAAWNARRFARDAFQRSVQRSTEHLLHRPTTPPTS